MISAGKYYCIYDKEYLYIENIDSNNYEQQITITGTGITAGINKEFYYYVNRNIQIASSNLYNFKEISREEFIEKTSEILEDTYIQLLKIGK